MFWTVSVLLHISPHVYSKNHPKPTKKSPKNEVRISASIFLPFSTNFSSKSTPWIPKNIENRWFEWYICDVGLIDFSSILGAFRAPFGRQNTLKWGRANILIGSLQPTARQRRPGVPQDPQNGTQEHPKGVNLDPKIVKTGKCCDAKLDPAIHG